MKECPLTPTRKKYLRAIYEESLKGIPVRSARVCEQLGVTRSSFAAMARDLKTAGYIAFDPYGPISFTPRGMAKAEALFKKHVIVSRFFETVLDLDRETARNIAEEFTPVITPTVLDKLRRLTDTPLDGAECETTAAD